MRKNKLVLVAVVFLFTIALVCGAFLNCKEVVGTNDQVVIELNSESVNDDIVRVEKVIIEDENSECITLLSATPANNQVTKNQYIGNKEYGRWLELLGDIDIDDEDVNPEYYLRLSTGTTGNLNSINC